MTIRLKLELYNEGRAYMPQYGCQLSGQCDLKEDSVVLYRACCEHLGPHAAESQNFKGVDCYEKDQTRSKCITLCCSTCYVVNGDAALLQSHFK